MLRQWADRLRTKNTRKNYVPAVRRFLDYYAATPEESIAWTAELAEDRILAYRDHLLHEGYAGNTVKIHLTGIKRWFVDNRVRVMLQLRDLPQEKTYLDYIPSRADVQNVLDDLRMHYKVGLALVAFSGLRPSDAVTITYEHIKRSYEAHDKILTIVKRHRKSRVWYVSFLGTQGTRYIKTLLEQRVQHGEVLRASTPIVSKNGQPLDVQALLAAINRALVRRVGKHPTGEQFRVFRPYGFRKFFRRTVGQLGESIAEYLMGHMKGLLSLASTYNGLRDLDPQAIEALKKEYIKILPELETEVTDTTLKARLEQESKDKRALADRIQEIQEEQREIREFLKELSRHKT